MTVPGGLAAGVGNALPVLADGLQAFAADSWRAFAADAAIICLTGGMATLAFIMALVTLQGFVPDRRPAPERVADEPMPELRPLLGARPVLGDDQIAAPLDRALVRFVRHGRGEPRVTRHSGGVTRIRVYHCSECSPELVGHAHARPDACVQQRAFLGTALRGMQPPPRRVNEARCTLRGDPWCEFEVQR